MIYLLFAGTLLCIFQIRRAQIQLLATNDAGIVKRILYKNLLSFFVPLACATGLYSTLAFAVSMIDNDQTTYGLLNTTRAAIQQGMAFINVIRINKTVSLSITLIGFAIALWPIWLPNLLGKTTQEVVNETGDFVRSTIMRYSKGVGAVYVTLLFLSAFSFFHDNAVDARERLVLRLTKISTQYTSLANAMRPIVTGQLREEIADFVMDTAPAEFKPVIDDTFAIWLHREHLQRRYEKLTKSLGANANLARSIKQASGRYPITADRLDRDAKLQKPIAPKTLVLTNVPAKASSHTLNLAAASLEHVSSRYPINADKLVQDAKAQNPTLPNKLTQKSASSPMLNRVAVSLKLSQRKSFTAKLFALLIESAAPSGLEGDMAFINPVVGASKRTLNQVSAHVVERRLIEPLIQKMLHPTHPLAVDELISSRTRQFVRREYQPQNGWLGADLKQITDATIMTARLTELRSDVERRIDEWQALRTAELEAQAGKLKARINKNLKEVAMAFRTQEELTRAAFELGMIPFADKDKMGLIAMAEELGPKYHALTVSDFEKIVGSHFSRAEIKRVNRQIINHTERMKTSLDTIDLLQKIEERTSTLANEFGPPYELDYAKSWAKSSEEIDLGFLGERRRLPEQKKLDIYERTLSRYSTSRDGQSSFQEFQEEALEMRWISYEVRTPSDQRWGNEKMMRAWKEKVRMETEARLRLIRIIKGKK